MSNDSQRRAPLNVTSRPVTEAAANRKHGSIGRPMLSALYTQNPFYLIGSGIVLLGVKTTIGNHPAFADQPIVITLALWAFTITLAMTGVLLVRLWQIWDDARTIFLVIILMQGAISCQLDSLWLIDPTLAFAIQSAGFLLSILIAESVLKLLALPLSSGYRIALHGSQLLLFLAPGAYVLRESFYQDFSASWISLGFAFVSSAIGLCLVGALQKTRSEFEGHSHWRWPYYPWSLFVVIGSILIGRTWLLSLSFEPARQFEFAFDGFFLVPFVLTVCIILFELGYREKLPRLQTIAMMLAPTMFLLSLPWNGSETATAFQSEIVRKLGSPVWIGFAGMILFYGIGLGRQKAGSEVLLTLTLIASCFFSETTTQWQDAFPQNGFPLLVLAAIQFSLVREKMTSRRALAGAGYASLAAGSYLQNHFGFEIGSISVAALSGFAALAITVWFQDRFAYGLRVFLTAALPIGAGLVGCLVLYANLVADTWYFASCGGLVVVLMFAWKWVPDRLFGFSAGMTALVSAAILTMDRVLNVQNSADASMIQTIFAVAICFSIAIFLSGLKAGLGKSIRHEWLRTVAIIRRNYRKAGSAG